MKKLIYAGLLTATLIGCSNPNNEISTGGNINHFRMKVREESDLESIMVAQEEILGIEFHSVPKVILDELPPSVKEHPIFLGQIRDGYYEQGIIYIPKHSGLLEQKNGEGLLQTILSHELGHHYVYQVMIEKEFEPPNREEVGNYIYFLGLQGHQLMNEGIATYLSAAITGGGCSFGEFPDKIDDYNDYIIYVGGFHLVHELVEEHGIGVLETMIMNPPNVLEITDIEAYKERIRELVKE